MIQLDTKRHDYLFDKNACVLPIHVIGVGGIGSHVVLELSKLGVGTNIRNTLHVYDGDAVESHNISNQAYELSDIGMQKVRALERHFSTWSGGNTVTVHDEFVSTHAAFAGVVFLCVDSNQVRKDILEAFVWNNPEVQLVIDTRMDARNAVVFSLDPNNKDQVSIWEDYWFPDEQAENLASCGGPISVITAVSITASIAVQQFITYAKTRDFSLLKNHVRITLEEWETKATAW